VSIKEKEGGVSTRTTVRFRYDGEISPLIEKWARENGYRPKESNASEPVYQKGIGFLVAPMMLKVRHDNGETVLEAWVRVPAFVRLTLLFLIPAEMGIESGGLKLAAPRSIARKAVNRLLVELEQPQIA
jgi:hypothetical protein